MYVSQIHKTKCREKIKSFPFKTLASPDHLNKRFSGAPVYIIHMARLESRRSLESEGGDSGGTEESDGANDAVGRGSTLDRLVG